MPELPEVEAYRRLAALAVGRHIASIDAPDAWYLKRGLTARGLQDAAIGRRLTDARRIGKLLLLDTDDADGPTVGLRFGMTGRLLLDGVPGVERLQYTSAKDVPAWDRFTLHFEEGGDLRVRDPRRLGGVLLDPEEGMLGVDATSVSPAALRDLLAGSTAPLKARLMDQARLAGVGNLIADEVLWRASLDPVRRAGGLSPAEVRRLHRHLRATLGDLDERGGSHLGDLIAERRPGGVCPKDGTPLVRRTIGGRTTWSCPRHQG